VAELPIPGQLKEIILQSGISEFHPPQEEATEAGFFEKAIFIIARPLPNVDCCVAVG